MILGVRWLENHGEEVEARGQSELAQQPMPWQHHDEHHEEQAL